MINTQLISQISPAQPAAAKYAGFDIEITLSRYGLFDGLDSNVATTVNESATRELFAAATLETLDAIYAGATVSVCYQYEETPPTRVRVEGRKYEENEGLKRDVIETLETVEMFDYSDESLWVYNQQ